MGKKKRKKKISIFFPEEMDINKAIIFNLGKLEIGKNLVTPFFWIKIASE